MGSGEDELLPSAAKAAVFFMIYTYGLKPVPFNLLSPGKSHTLAAKALIDSMRLCWG